jgi:hypothetical protein
VRTNASGQALIRYTAPEFSGRMEFVGISVRDTTIRGRDTLMIKVDSLFALPPDTVYELVGAPDNHRGTNDPCRTNPPTSLHYSNHYGTRAMLAAIDSIARNYNRLHPGVRLRVNDISLEWGGLFDNHLNDWRYHRERTHFEHRIGKSADIGFSGIDRNGRCVIEIYRPDLIDLIELFTNDDVYPHRDHYHIRMR